MDHSLQESRAQTPAQTQETTGIEDAIEASRTQDLLAEAWA